ncbi:MAG TPA: HNH endonuclease signature motif containing protein, partial [Polyangiaceae bacterium]
VGLGANQPGAVDLGANQPGAFDLGTNQPSAPGLGAGQSSNAKVDAIEPCTAGLGVGAKPGVNAILPSNTAFGSNRPSEANTRAADRPRVQPLSESRYRIVFTASEALKQKLDRARELCSHCVSPTDLPALIERALDLLIEREEKRRFAVRSPKPRASRPEQESVLQQEPVPQQESVLQQEPDPVATVSNELPSTPSSALGSKQEPDPVATISNELPSKRRTDDGAKERPKPSEPCKPRRAEVRSERSRTVPAPVLRAVWERDGGQCSFVDDEGHRCTERRFLEIDHVNPFAHGGPSTIENCRLLCRSHNLYHAKRIFGPAVMNRARSRPRSK